jgi:hypothetical protein
MKGQFIHTLTLTIVKMNSSLLRYECPQHQQKHPPRLAARTQGTTKLRRRMILHQGRNIIDLSFLIFGSTRRALLVTKADLPTRQERRRLDRKFARGGNCIRRAGSHPRWRRRGLAGARVGSGGTSPRRVGPGRHARADDPAPNFEDGSHRRAAGQTRTRSAIHRRLDVERLRVRSFGADGL